MSAANAGRSSRRVPPPSAGSATAVPDAPRRPGARSPGRGPSRRAARGRRAVEAVEHVRQVLGRDAGAVVAHRDLAAADGHLDRRAAGRAPLDGVVEQVRDRAREARRGCRAPASARRRRARARAVACRARASSRDQLVEAHVLDLVERGSSVAREVDQVADEQRQLLELRARRGDDLGALGSRAGPFARPSTSMFVRRLVSGVRSSCDASATSWRWASRERSSAASIVLNAAPRRPISSSCRPTSMRRDEVLGRGDVLGLGGQPRASARRAARDGEAQPAGERDAAEADGQQDDAQPLERAVDLGERARDDQLAPLTGPARDEDAQVRAVALDVARSVPALGREQPPLGAGSTCPTTSPSGATTWALPVAPPNDALGTRTAKRADAPGGGAGAASQPLAEHLHARHDRAQPVVDLAAQRRAASRR